MWKRGENWVNQLIKRILPPAIMDKRPWDSDAVFIIFCNFWVPSKYRASFLKYSCSSPSPTLHPIQSWDYPENTGYTCPTVFVERVEGLGMCLNWKMPQKCKSAPRLLPKVVGILLIPRRNLYLSLTAKANRQITFCSKSQKKSNITQKDDWSRATNYLL